MATAPTAGEWAYSMAQDHATQLQDAMILIGWLCGRVIDLEEQVGIAPDPRPTLASQINGFGCIPNREKAVAEAMAKAF